MLRGQLAAMSRVPARDTEQQIKVLSGGRFSAASCRVSHLGGIVETSAAADVAADVVAAVAVARGMRPFKEICSKSRTTAFLFPSSYSHNF